MSPGAISPLAPVKALTFDIFGTVVDWRTSVIDELELRVHRKLSATGDDALSTDLRERLEYLNEQFRPEGRPSWTARFADAWRASYWQFVRSQARAGTQDAATFKTTDEHFHESLVEIIEEWLFEDLFSETELQSLSLVWHRLTPWADSADGLAKLAAPPLGLTTATLSNGSTSLIQDLVDFGNLPFQHQFCAESLKSYKPAPETYLGAARELGLKPEEVAMVAAHMADLEAAKDVGMRTIYVERGTEEAWGKEQLEQAKSWVDLWIKEGEDGFIGMAKRLEELRV